MTCNCNFQQCFVMKATVFSPHDKVLLQSSILTNLILKKIKSTKIILEKNFIKKENTKETKKNHVRKNCINP